MNVTLLDEHADVLPAESVILPQYVVDEFAATATTEIENEPNEEALPLPTTTLVHVLFVNSCTPESGSALPLIVGVVLVGCGEPGVVLLSVGGSAVESSMYSTNSGEHPPTLPAASVTLA